MLRLLHVDQLNLIQLLSYIAEPSFCELVTRLAARSPALRS